MQNPGNGNLAQVVRLEGAGANGKSQGPRDQLLERRERRCIWRRQRGMEVQATCIPGFGLWGQGSAMAAMRVIT